MDGKKFYRIRRRFSENKLQERITMVTISPSIVAVASPMVLPQTTQVILLR